MVDLPVDSGPTMAIFFIGEIPFSIEEVVLFFPLSADDNSSSIMIAHPA
jgi:hypothetical protein